MEDIYDRALKYLDSQPALQLRDDARKTLTEARNCFHECDDLLLFLKTTLKKVLVIIDTDANRHGQAMKELVRPEMPERTIQANTLAALRELLRDSATDSSTALHPSLADLIAVAEIQDRANRTLQALNYKAEVELEIFTYVTIALAMNSLAVGVCEFLRKLLSQALERDLQFTVLSQRLAQMRTDLESTLKGPIPEMVIKTLEIGRASCRERV